MPLMFRHRLRAFLAKSLSILVLLASYGEAAASRPALDAVLPAQRRLTWSAGIPGGIPDVPVEANVRDFGAVGDGISDDTAAIRNAIASVTSGGAVYFPEGAYLITSTLKLDRSVVLRGAGAGRTSLLVRVSGTPIAVEYYGRGPWIALTGGYTRGSTQVTVSAAAASQFTPGAFVEIQQTNDASVMYTRPAWNVSWAQAAVGQIARVAGVAGNVITLDEPIRHDYKASLNPVIRTQVFVERVGIEKLHIKRLSRHSSPTILLKNTAYSWVRQVHSELAVKAHVNAESAYRCEIRDSYFDNAQDFGSGGEGYGVALSLHTTNCLVENNIFRRLRHAMLVHLGANGNVFTYNYSRENIQNQSAGWTPPDIALHGHYPYDNLFDSNVVQQIEVADYWGPAGPRNTFCRNKVENSKNGVKGQHGEAVRIQDMSHGQNLIGNDLVIGAISIAPGVQDTYLNGNRLNYNGATDWITSATAVPPSCYYSTRPAFYGDMPWPSVGYDKPGGTIPALERWQNGSYIP